ncbi:hypothetical protein ACHAWO_007958 [Cyclotella atomus]|uniref:Secreted protein n=1 Tax=Cyclotella atomus TaxID=382360 RepID=A0ABD3N2J6_9STRA
MMVVTWFIASFLPASSGVFNSATRLHQTNPIPFSTEASRHTTETTSFAHGKVQGETSPND